MLAVGKLSWRCLVATTGYSWHQAWEISDTDGT